MTLRSLPDPVARTRATPVKCTPNRLPFRHRTVAGNVNCSRATAAGYIAQNRLGTTNFTTFHTTLDAKTAQVCDLIKSSGVIVYSFAYSVTNTNAKNMIKNCASSPEKYFDPPSNAALVASFNQIAAELRNLYLSK